MKSQFSNDITAAFLSG